MKRASAERGFILPLVMLLALVAAGAMVILFSRRGTSAVASYRQSDNYVSHHFQSGLRDLVTVVLQTTQRNSQAHLAGGVVAFDASLDQGLKLEVRLIDAQGGVLASTEPGESIRLTINHRAAARLLERGLNDERYLRSQGSARISIHAAPREVLEAVALAVDESCDGEAFAAAVLAARENGDIPATNVRTLLTQGKMAPDKVELGEQMFASEPTLWWARARVLDRDGREVFAQGGLMNGALKKSSGFLASAWTAVSWGPIPADGLPGFRHIEGRPSNPGRPGK